MKFVRCDRCKKEIPYSSKFSNIAISTIPPCTPLDNEMDSCEFRQLDLCSECMKGIDLYLQRKVDNYADLMKL